MLWDPTSLSEETWREEGEAGTGCLQSSEESSRNCFGQLTLVCKSSSTGGAEFWASP